MSSFIIVSAYTKKTNYENIVKNLEADCFKLKVPFQSIAYDSTGVWVENTMLKPKLILSIWDQLIKNNQALIWLDADARLNSYPKYFRELIEAGRDFSVFQMGSIARVTSGTIFIRLNDKMKTFVKEWAEICRVTKNRRGDQQCLRELIAKDAYPKMKISYQPLPYSYCYIFDDTLRKLEPRIKQLEGEAVITHMQASRDRNNVN